jgi:Protein of unknown function (DUF3224)/3-demethylubiquinone-9 3-methyltransferase
LGHVAAQGDVLTVEFTVMGIACMSIDGGQAFKQSEAFSFQVASDDRAETWSAGWMAASSSRQKTSPSPTSDGACALHGHRRRDADRAVSGPRGVSGSVPGPAGVEADRRGVPRAGCGEIGRMRLDNSPTTRRAIVQAAVLLPIGAQAQGRNRMSRVAKGSFTVEMKPQGEANAADGVTTGRMSLSKRFEGDLVAVGQGEMLTALTPVKGSAGYVAIERITGTLHGRAGSFVFQHSGTMNQGAQQLSIRVVPGSGTGGLAGIEGVFKLDIVEGKHFYEFEYTLP